MPPTSSSPHHLLIRPWLSYLAGTFLGRKGSKLRNATSKLPVSPLCLLLAAFFHLRRRRGRRRGKGKSTNGRLYRHGTILHSIRGGSREGMNVKFEFHSSFNFILAFFLNVFFCSRIENAFIHLLPRYLDGILFSFLIFA